MFIVSLCIIFMFSVLVYRLFNLQILNEDYYRSTYIQKAEKIIYTPGTRGIITDSKGNILAYNKIAYSVVIEDILEDSDDEKLNTIAYNAIKIIEKHGDKVNVSFPIIKNKKGKYEYSVTSESARLRFLKDFYGEELDTEKHTYSQATASEAFEYICDTFFEIDKKYTEDEKLQIAAIRYKLYQNSYQKYIQTTIATEVCEETMAAIYENEADIPGVSVTEQAVRVYNHSEYFAPIIGYTGTISSEQLEQFVKEGKDYFASDVVGKSGIEASMEEELQGTRGEEKIFTDSTGNKISTISKTESVAGNNVALTLDLDLQIATYDLLEKKIAGTLIGQIVNYDVSTDDDEDDDSDNHPIGIKEVYFQLINNNVVTVEHLSKKSTPNEEKVYSKYTTATDNAVNKVIEQLADDNVIYNDLKDEYQDYHSFIYDELKEDTILISSSIKIEDEVYKKWNEGTISLNDFLKHAIVNQWIDISALEVGNDYATTDEIYTVLVEYIKNMLTDNVDFGKKVIYYRLYDGTIHGSEICMLLYDQKVFEYDEDKYNSLAGYNNNVTYDFIIDQIKSLNITPAQLALDPCSGSVVITDPNNGNVLALVTYPSYDNNMFSGSVDPTYWAKLIEDNSDPLYNRATQGLTAPGSTFKMVSAIAGLEEGIIAGPEDLLETKGIFEEITPSPKCWIYSSGHATHGTINVMEALAYSCNYYFYNVGYELGKNAKDKYDSELGLENLEKYTSLLGINMLSGVEIIESEPKFSTDSSIHSAIGQGSHSYAPVQLSRYVSTIANGGNNYQLTIIDKVTTTNDELVYKKEPVLTNTVDIAESTWNSVHVGMREVITKGTVKSIFKDMTIEVAGKSGTAEESTKRNAHALFVAYAPYENPEISVVSVIPFANKSGVAAELTRDVIKYYYGEINAEDIANSQVSATYQDTHD